MQDIRVMQIRPDLSIAAKEPIRVLRYVARKDPDFLLHGQSIVSAEKGYWMASIPRRGKEVRVIIEYAQIPARNRKPALVKLVLYHPGETRSNREVHAFCDRQARLRLDSR